jgi:hypothetical protein
MPESGGLDQKVLVKAGNRRPRVTAPDAEAAWRWVGWVGVVLLLAGFGDLGLALYPTAFGRPEWEFTTVAQVVSSLPLVTLGFAGLLGSGVARGKRWLTVGTAWCLVVWAVALFAGLGLFLTNVPMALGAAQGMALTGIKKAIAKTVWLGLVFLVAYGWAAVAALRHVRTATERRNA